MQGSEHMLELCPAEEEAGVLDFADGRGPKIALSPIQLCGCEEVITSLLIREKGWMDLSHSTWEDFYSSKVSSPDLSFSLFILSTQNNLRRILDLQTCKIPKLKTGKSGMQTLWVNALVDLWER